MSIRLRICHFRHVVGLVAFGDGIFKGLFELRPVRLMSGLLLMIGMRLMFASFILCLCGIVVINFLVIVNLSATII